MTQPQQRRRDSRASDAPDPWRAKNVRSEPAPIGAHARRGGGERVTGSAVMPRMAADPAARARGRSRLPQWRRRHLNLRKIVALLVLASFLAPGVVALIAAVV
jgi:hypothetical protein